MEYISRKDLPKDYREMMKTERHHNHPIIRDSHGVLRWKESNIVRESLENISLNDLLPLFIIMGYGKNSEIYRELYRNMGYSLSGYWEVFYWDVNNEDTEEYRPPHFIIRFLNKYLIRS